MCSKCNNWSWRDSTDGKAVTEMRDLREAQRQKERDRADRRLCELERREQLQREIEAITWTNREASV